MTPTGREGSDRLVRVMTSRIVGEESSGGFARQTVPAEETVVVRIVRVEETLHRRLRSRGRRGGRHSLLGSRRPRNLRGLRRREQPSSSLLLVVDEETVGFASRRRRRDGRGDGGRLALPSENRVLVVEQSARPRLRPRPARVRPRLRPRLRPSPPPPPAAASSPAPRGRRTSSPTGP